MKIAYISSSTIPSRTANSIHVMKICQAFAKSGHEVFLLTQDRKDELEKNVSDVYAYYGVDNCFEFMKIPCRNIRIAKFIYGFLAARKAKGIKPDIVFSRDITGALFAAKFGLPVIFEFHMSVAENSGRIPEQLFRLLIKSSGLQKMVVITHALKEYYVNRYPQLKGIIQVAPDAADPIPEHVQPAFLANKGKRLQVGYTGHLYKGRGIEIIFELAKACRWADFHLVGGTEKDICYWKEKLEQQANVIFHGFVPPSEAVTLRMAFDSVIAPYQQKIAITGSGGDTARWMSPLKIFEYMAAAKPIIASDMPALREVLTHNRNALLCSSDNVHEWQSSLETLRDDAELRNKLGNAAYSDFLNHYTWEKRAINLLENCKLHERLYKYQKLN